jgi:hypothetical protein
MVLIGCAIFGTVDLHAAQSVDIEKTPASNNGSPSYKVTLDFGGADDYDAHFIVGQKYAEAVLKVFKDQGGFETAISTCLRKSVNELERNGIRYKDMMNRVTNLMGKSDKEGDEYYLAGAEIEGMTSVLNSSRNGYSARDRLWLLMFNENQLTLRELYLLGMILSGIAPHAPNPGIFNGLKAVYIVKNRGPRKDQVCEGILGCLFNTAKAAGDEKMISGMDSGVRAGTSR